MAQSGQTCAQIHRSRTFTYTLFLVTDSNDISSVHDNTSSSLDLSLFVAAMHWKTKSDFGHKNEPLRQTARYLISKSFLLCGCYVTCSDLFF
jgi:hypothetical protein